MKHGIDQDPRATEARTPAPPPRGPRRALRVLIPALIILLWFAGAAVGGPYFGKVAEVSSNDQTAYLPESADATRVQAALADFRDGDDVPAVLVFASDSPLTSAQTAALDDAVAGLGAIPGVADGRSPLLPSADGLAMQGFVPISADADLGETVDAIRAHLAETAPTGVREYVTGPAGFSSDLGAAFSGIDGLLLLVALGAVFLILIIVYRSLLLPVAVLATSMFALCVALLTVWWLAKAEIFLLSGQTQGILFILVIGAATDYSLLYVSRYREALLENESTLAATRVAWRGSLEPILASGGTVIVGLLCLLLSELNSNKTLGPVAAVGIAFAMLAALTLLPALLYAFGRAAFWPRRPRFDAVRAAQPHELPTAGVWGWLTRIIRRRPRLIWVVTVAVLAVGALGLTQLKADGVPASEFVLGQSQARDGQRALGEHFPGGSGSPASVLVAEADQERAQAVLLGNPGVDELSIASAESPSGSAPVTADGVQALGPPGTPAPEPTVADGRVLLQATLHDAADSSAAADTVRELRAELDGWGLIGGVTATAIDTNDAAVHDRTLIIPIVLVVIFLILMLLLRAVVAPLILIATVVLSFGTAMGLSALVFNHVFQFPGADPVVPLFGFVFLVALGIDYNIFLMTRVREESIAHGTREGILRGLAITGGVITSAGLVLAATFAALAVLPILFLVQLAFIVAAGVLIDTFIVRSLLVPALATDIGAAIWWPSKLARSAGSVNASLKADHSGA